MEYLVQVESFIHSNDFWIYHGFVLSGLWVFASAFGILVKKFSTTLHVLTFLIVDFTTLFFAGAALFRVSAGFNNFSSWSLLKQGHVLGGAVFLVLVILQHLGGIQSYFQGKKNPIHRKFGKFLVTIGRAIAAVGWLLGGNQQNAIIVAVISVVILGLALALGNQEAPKESIKQSSRSKSPRAKRQ